MQNKTTSSGEKLWEHPPWIDDGIKTVLFLSMSSMAVVERVSTVRWSNT